MQTKQPAVYMVTNKHNTALYIGVTSNLPARMWQHKNRVVAGFSASYNTHKLVYFEMYADMYTALSREKKLKGWSRSRKNDLIQTSNPTWRDLADEIL